MMANGNRWYGGAVVLACVLVACGGDDGVTPDPVPPDECPAPNRLVEDGSCLAPGVQEDGCPAGTTGLGDGSCQAAGIPPESCAEGFLPLAEGCEPILPSELCPPGQLAVPGDETCRPVKPCGSGRWGDLPVDGATVYVDASYAGGNSDGSEAAPWTTIGEAVDAAEDDGFIAVAEGSYLEDVRLTGKPVQLWGVCPEKVEIVGTGAALAAVLVQAAQGTVVGGLAITGQGDFGYGQTAARNVELVEVWIHDTAGRGIDAESTQGSASLVVRDSLIETARGTGMYFAGAEVTVERTVVRGTQPRPGGPGGIGIYANEGPFGNPTMIDLRWFVSEHHSETGMYVNGSDATIEASVVRDTQPRLADQTGGLGLVVTTNPDTGASSTLALRTSVIARNHAAGLLIQGAIAEVDAVVVQGTLPRASDQTLGIGLQVQGDDVTRAQATLTLRDSLIDSNHHSGLVVAGSHATVEGTLVRRTLPRGADGTFGRGASFESDPSTSTPATVSVRGGAFVQNRQTGIFVGNSTVTCAGCRVAGTQIDGADRFGDGLVILQGDQPASATLSACSIADSARAAVASFGAVVSLASTKMQCQIFDLAGESSGTQAFSFEDLGGNACGCPVAEGECDAETAGLEAPQSAL